MAKESQSVKQMWNILFGEYIKAKEVLKTKSGVKALKKIAPGFSALQKELGNVILRPT